MGGGLINLIRWVLLIELVPTTGRSVQQDDNLHMPDIRLSQ
jgi:hypothetical protein